MGYFFNSCVSWVVRCADIKISPRGKLVTAIASGDYKVVPRKVKARVLAPGATQRVRRWGAICIALA
ncbi:hypothetical protein [Nostoc commune]|uniref:hypothetical protein n=1 Tax=Nostoc commune TaxID=1178 RepID=UPI0018C4B1C6|nr:hypothetical protein [Nostoc commune]MBG1263084.1 hypothetical protein [Nostoc commune BAE]